MSEQPEKPSSKGSKPKTNPFAGFAIDPSLLTPPDDAPALSIASDNVSVPKRHKRKQPGDGIDLNPAEVQVKTTADDDGEPPPMKKRKPKKKPPKERAETEMPTPPHPLDDGLLNRTNSRDRAMSSPPVFHGGLHRVNGFLGKSRLRYYNYSCRLITFSKSLPNLQPRSAETSLYQELPVLSATCHLQLILMFRYSIPHPPAPLKPRLLLLQTQNTAQRRMLQIYPSALHLSIMKC